ncbi:MAG TPA: hypothetical protein VGR10_04980 [Thermoleophilaceae bacterium]|nr:hypothetical protein [Thermoleophilaceae bacterium]
MRTTVTLEPDVRSLLERRMHDRGLSFKEALNETLREGLVQGEGGQREFRTPTHRMGFDPSVPLDRALQLAGELEDEELVRRLAARK